MKTFDSFSFGCRVNQAEKEALDRELVNRGYKRSTENPEVYILNTCAVTHKAEREARKHIYQINRKFPTTKVIVTGCAATNWKKQNLEVEGIDLLVDNPSKEFIADIIQKRIEKHSKSSDNIKKSLPQSSARDKFMRSGRVIVKIQDGCHRFCTYCIVPYLRGLPQSKSISQILNDVKDREEFKEVILTAINTEAYGRDSGENFNTLIETLLTQTRIPRFSFGSIHPWSFNDDFFNLYTKYATSKRFVHFFHIPLQSGSNKMLNLMKRGYTREEFIEKLHRIKAMNEFAFIGTDVIVGFLEETDADFQDTYDFMEQTPISKFHVFRFSKRQHTAAFYLSKRLATPSVEDMKKRSQALRKLSDRKYKQFLQKHVGRTFETLLLEKRENDWQHGLLENQIPVMVQTQKDMTGELKHVKIDSFRDSQLFGRIV